MALAINYFLNVDLDKFTVRLLTASILAAERFNKPDLKGQSLLGLSQFTRSKEGALSEAFSRTMLNTEYFITVTDDMTHFKRYRYTGGVPTYVEIKDSEAVFIVQAWLKKFFVEIPKEVDSAQFYSNLLRHLAAEKSLTKQRFEQMMPTGVFFQQGVVAITETSTQVQLLDYGPSIVTPDEIVHSNYEPLITSKSGSQSYVCISKETKNLLRVLCGDSNYNLNVLRYFLRNVITAPYDGRNRQSAVYLYGAPGTSKSVWVE